MPANDRKAFVRSPTTASSNGWYGGQPYQWGCWGGGWGTRASGAVPHLCPLPCCSSFVAGVAWAYCHADWLHPRSALTGSRTLAGQSQGHSGKGAPRATPFGKTPWRAALEGPRSSLPVVVCAELPQDPACPIKICHVIQCWYFGIMWCTAAQTYACPHKACHWMISQQLPSNAVNGRATAAESFQQ